MEDLIKRLTEHVGLNKEQAQKAIVTVVDFIKEKLPPMMHGAVDSFIQGPSTSQDDGLY